MTTHTDRLSRLEAASDARLEAERIVRVEAELEAHEDRQVRLERIIEHMEEKLDTLCTKIDRYESKLGGVLLAGTSIVAFISFVGEKGWEWLVHLFNSVPPPTN